MCPAYTSDCEASCHATLASQQLRSAARRMHLATHPDAQAILVQELQQAGVVRAAPSSSAVQGQGGGGAQQPQPLTAALLTRLPYLSAVCHLSANYGSTMQCLQPPVDAEVPASVYG